MHIIRQCFSTLPVYKPVISVVERIDVPNITREDIINFDLYYSPQTVAEFKTYKGKRYLHKKIYKPKIQQILAIKIGHNFENIINFLTHRDENITDIELAYCLNAIKAHHSFYLATIVDQYIPKIESLIQTNELRFTSLASLLTIVNVHNELAFLSIESINHIAEQITKYIQHFESPDQDSENEFHHLVMILQSLTQIGFTSNKIHESLIQIRTFITRHMNCLSLQDLIMFLSTISNNKQLLVTEPSSVRKVESELLLNYKILTTSDKIGCLKSFATFRMENCPFAEKFFIEIHPQIEDLQQFSNLLRMFTQFQYSKRTQGIHFLLPILEMFWPAMEEKFFEIYEKQPGGNFSLIVQVFGQSLKGSLMFWHKVEQMIDEKEDQFALLQNYLRLGYHNPNLIEQIIDQELKGREFRYLSKYDSKQKLTVFETFAQVGGHHPKFIKLLIRQINLSEENRSDYFNKSSLRLRFIISLYLIPIELAHVELRMALKKYKRLIQQDVLDAFEMVILFRILSERQDANRELMELLLNSVEGRVNQITQIDELLRITKLCFELGLSDKQLWTTLIIKVQKVIGAYSIDELAQLLYIFQSQLQNTQNFKILEFQITEMALKTSQSLFQLKESAFNFNRIQNLEELIALVNRSNT